MFFFTKTTLKEIKIEKNDKRCILNITWLSFYLLWIDFKSSWSILFNSNKIATLKHKTLTSEILHLWVCGLMDDAPGFVFGDCRFESGQVGKIFNFYPFLVGHIEKVYIIFWPHFNCKYDLLASPHPQISYIHGWNTIVVFSGKTFHEF